MAVLVKELVSPCATRESRGEVIIWPLIWCRRQLLGLILVLSLQRISRVLTYACFTSFRFCYGEIKSGRRIVDPAPMLAPSEPTKMMSADLFTFTRAPSVPT